MANRIDATFFTSSAAAPARKQGFVELFRVADLGVEVQGNGFATSRSYIASNRDTVKNALKGFVEAIYYVYANKKEAQKVFAKYMRTNDQEMLEDSYNGYIQWIPKKPYPTLKGIQYMLDLLAPQLPGEERQARTVRRSEFLARIGKGRLLQRYGKEVSDKVETRGTGVMEYWSDGSGANAIALQSLDRVMKNVFVLSILCVLYLLPCPCPGA